MCVAPNQQLVRDSVELPWLQVADNLETLTKADPKWRDSYIQRLAAWREFGRKCGINEGGLRSKVTAWRKAVANLPEGCSWVRCPLYSRSESVVSREFMLCSRCRSVSRRLACLETGLRCNFRPSIVVGLVSRGVFGGRSISPLTSLRAGSQGLEGW